MTYGGRKTMAVLLAVAAFAACGDDDDDDDDDTAAVTSGTVRVAASVSSRVSVSASASAGAVDTPNAVTVVATDYRFDGLPPTAPAGTTFNLRNDSTAEAHEMIMIRIPDTETRPIGQLVALPEEEVDAVFADVEPTTVIVALPGEQGAAVEGDGVLNDPGRYAVVCFIPKGGDVDALRAAMEAVTPPTDQPDMGSGPPHVVEGMYAEITIE